MKEVQHDMWNIELSGDASNDKVAPDVLELLDDLQMSDADKMVVAMGEC